jgi:hypothetical protein
MTNDYTAGFFGRSPQTSTLLRLCRMLVRGDLQKGSAGLKSGSDEN